MVITYALYKIATPMAPGSGMGAASNPFQERLFAELSGLHSPSARANEHARFKDGLQGNFHDIDSLPFLDALLKETLRLFGSGPSLHPRIIPPGKTLSIQGKAIPEGTEVGLQFMSMHRRSSVWERADEFLPERWLPSRLGGLGPEPGSDGYDQMMQHYMPFGPGTRSCAGKNLAMMVMKLVIASVVREFQIWVNNEETNEKTMEPRDSDFVGPLS
jgi:cytochrome P450